MANELKHHRLRHLINRFDWNCQPLNGSNISCFEDQNIISTFKNKILAFPIQKLKAKVDAFEFVVNVRTQGRKGSSAFQVLIMTQEETHM